MEGSKPLGTRTFRSACFSSECALSRFHGHFACFSLLVFSLRLGYQTGYFQEFLQLYTIS